MSTSLKERANYIIEDYTAEYNDLPYSERKRIRRLTAAEKILTIVQMLEKDKDYTTEEWRRRQRAWLKNLVTSYELEVNDER
jgi:hypothetical protein